MNKIINTGVMRDIASQMEKNINTRSIEEIANIADNCVIAGLGSLSDGGVTKGLARNINSEYSALVNDLKQRVDNYQGKIAEIKKTINTNSGTSNANNNKNMAAENQIDVPDSNSQNSNAATQDSSQSKNDFLNDSSRIGGDKYKYKYETIDNGNGELYVNMSPEDMPAYYNVYDAKTGKLKGSVNQYVFENGMNNGNRTYDSYNGLRGSDYDRELDFFASHKSDTYQYNTIEKGDGKIYVDVSPKDRPAYYNVYDATSGEKMGGISEAAYNLKSIKGIGSSSNTTFNNKASVRVDYKN